MSDDDNANEPVVDSAPSAPDFLADLAKQMQEGAADKGVAKILAEGLVSAKPGATVEQIVNSLNALAEERCKPQESASND